MEKRKQIIIIIIGIVTIILTIAGATFVYLSLLIVNEDYLPKSIIQTKSYATLITYEQNGQILMNNAVPGTTKTINLTITNANPNDEIMYYLYWSNITNNFDMTNKDLVYSVTCTEGNVIQDTNKVVDKLLPISGSQEELAPIQSLAPEATNTCQIEIKYLQLAIIQNNNMNKSFEGTIKVGLR